MSAVVDLVGEVFEASISALVAGGRGMGRTPDGRVMFVRGAAVGDTLRVRVIAEHKRHLDAEIAEIVAASPDRATAPCPEVAAGCGGCDWQHLVHAAQLRAKRAIVIDALQHTGGLEDPQVNNTVGVHPSAYRTTMRAAVDNEGRGGLRRRGSDQCHRVNSCLVAHPRLEELLVDGRFLGNDEVVLRVSESTGQRIAVVSAAEEEVVVPDDVVVVSRQRLAAGKRVWIFETVGGIEWRVSATSFFQPGPAGAEVLVAEVQRMIGADGFSAELAGGRLLDAYCGVGLFGGSVAAGELIAVESDPSSAADARINLAGRYARVRRRDLASWNVQPVVAAIADPPRSGMEKEALERVLAAKPQRLIMVSCDAPTFARDAARLTERGYRLMEVTPIDQFGHTSHVETVARFDRS